MSQLLLDHPQFDYGTLEAVIRGRLKPARVPMVELFLDQEVLLHILREHLGKQWISVDDSIDAHHMPPAEFYSGLGDDTVRYAGSAGVYERDTECMHARRYSPLRRGKQGDQKNKGYAD